MKRKVTSNKKSKTSGKRSATRLGVKRSKMEASKPKSALGIKPAIAYWKLNQSRFFGLCVLVLFVWVLYLTFSVGDFFVYSAEIRGNRILAAEEIYAASQVDSLSVFWVNPKTVKANVEALPNIKTADVSLTLPSNLRIDVVERSPEIIWKTGDAVWWIDNEGTFVPPRAEVPVDDKRLHIIDAEGRPIQANDQIDLSIVRGAQLVQQQKPDIYELLYTQQHGLIYRTPEGWPVYLGRSKNVDAKLLVADSVRYDLLAREVTPTFIDVRNPLRAVYKE